MVLLNRLFDTWIRNDRFGRTVLNDRMHENNTSSRKDSGTPLPGASNTMLVEAIASDARFGLHFFFLSNRFFFNFLRGKRFSWRLCPWPRSVRFRSICLVRTDLYWCRTDGNTRGSVIRSGRRVPGAFACGRPVPFRFVSFRCEKTAFRRNRRARHPSRVVAPLVLLCTHGRGRSSWFSWFVPPVRPSRDAQP